MSKAKRVVETKVEENLISMIVDFANKNGMTISNIKDAAKKTVEFMEDNATLKMEDSNGIESSKKI